MYSIPYLDLFSSYQAIVNDSVLEASYWVTFGTNFLDLLTGPITTKQHHLFSIT